MKTALYDLILAAVVICALLAATAMPAKAQSGPIGCGPKCGNEIIGAAAGVLAVGGTGIGLGIYYAVHQTHFLSGCVVSGANGLELQTRGGQETFALAGVVSDIKPGERIRVFGKKEKKVGDAPREFLVEQFKRDYGPCAPSSGAR